MRRFCRFFNFFKLGLYALTHCVEHHFGLQLSIVPMTNPCDCSVWIAHNDGITRPGLHGDASSASPIHLLSHAEQALR